MIVITTICIALSIYILLLLGCFTMLTVSTKCERAPYTRILRYVVEASVLLQIMPLTVSLPGLETILSAVLKLGSAYFLCASEVWIRGLFISLFVFMYGTFILILRFCRDFITLFIQEVVKNVLGNVEICRYSTNPQEFLTVWRINAWEISL